MKKYRPVSLQKVKTYSIRKRKSKVSLSALSTPSVIGGTFREFLDRLPDVLAAGDFLAVVRAIMKARQRDKPVVLGMGGHTIKVGLSPLVIDLMRKGVITAIATNGACVIHAFDISFIGNT